MKRKLQAWRLESCVHKSKIAIGVIPLYIKKRKKYTPCVLAVHIQKLENGREYHGSSIFIYEQMSRVSEAS